MNYVLLIFSMFLLTSGYCQLDTACIQTRWISVKNSPENAILFQPSTSILKAIRKHTHEHKLTPYHSDCSFKRYQSMTPSPLMKIDSNFIMYDNLFDSSHHFITIYAQSDIYLVDEYGEPLTQTEEDGTTTILYEEPEIYRINLDELVEIRIQENRNENGEFVPTEIGFYTKEDYHLVEELFWFNLSWFMKEVESPSKHPWYAFLQNREYVGFQYKQVSCYDDIIR